MGHCIKNMVLCLNPHQNFLFLFSSSKTPAAPSVQETVAEDAGHEEDEERVEETQPEEEEPLVVPRVKVAEDGSLIIDEERSVMFLFILSCCSWRCVVQELVKVKCAVFPMLKCVLFCCVDVCSLTVQVSRAKGPNPAEDRDPIFERGSTTTYSSFRKGTYTKPWSSGGQKSNTVQLLILKCVVYISFLYFFCVYSRD